jgi:hypothetical protein
MATPGGYDYTKTLLEAGTGPIRAMSGGGDGVPPTPTYNAGASLIPPVSAAAAPIPEFKGGFYGDVILTGGEDGKSTIGQERVQAAIASREAAKVPDSTSVITPPANVTITPAPAPASTTIAIGPPSDDSGNTPPPDSSKPKPEEVLKEDENKTKDIILFGESITLENPDNNEPFTESQIKALKAFGLEGPGVNDSQKRDILKAIYERKCNSDKPLAMLEQCEPVRRIVQSLALNLLSKLGTNGKPSSNITKEEAPEVNYEKLGDGSMKVSILFKPEQLGLLSKFKPEVEKKNNNGKNKPSNKPPNSDNNSGSEGTPAFNTGLPNPPTTTPVLSSDASVVNSTSSAASVPGESIDELKLNEELESILEEIKTFKETNNSNPENLKQTITKFSNNIKNIKSTANENKNLNNKLEEVAAYLESTTNKSLTKQNIANMEEELEDFHKFLNASPQTSSKDVSKSENVYGESSEEYKECAFTAEELNEKFKIREGIKDKIDIMEIPSDGWCLYSAIDRSINGKFTEGGSAYSFIPEILNKVADYLKDNKDDIQRNILDNLKVSDLKPKTQPEAGNIEIQTVDEYIKYLTAPRKYKDSPIPSDAKVKCNKNNKEGFLYEDKENTSIFALIEEGPALWPDFQMVGPALASIYNKSIVVFNKNKNNKYSELTYASPKNKTNNIEAIYLLYNGSNHYDVLIPKAKKISDYLKKINENEWNIARNLAGKKIKEENKENVGNIAPNVSPENKKRLENFLMNNNSDKNGEPINQEITPANVSKISLLNNNSSNSNDNIGEEPSADMENRGYKPPLLANVGLLNSKGTWLKDNINTIRDRARKENSNKAANKKEEPKSTSGTIPENLQNIASRAMNSRRKINPIKVIKEAKKAEKSKVEGGSKKKNNTQRKITAIKNKLKGGKKQTKTFKKSHFKQKLKHKTNKTMKKQRK